MIELWSNYDKCPDFGPELNKYLDDVTNLQDELRQVKYERDIVSIANELHISETWKIIKLENQNDLLKAALEDVASVGRDWKASYCIDVAMEALAKLEDA